MAPAVVHPHVGEHVHLGWTAYGSRWWGTAINPDATLLLLTPAGTLAGAAAGGYGRGDSAGTSW